ncbi:MAG: LPXTG cell wall anchor domain-containing protein [Acidimicrobiales bacterium]
MLTSVPPAQTVATGSSGSATGTTGATTLAFTGAETSLELVLAGLLLLLGLVLVLATRRVRRTS